MINKIVKIIDEWKANSLTWDLLIDAITNAGHPRYTRQALDKKDRIKSAYRTRKEILRLKKKDEPLNFTLPAALKRIEELSDRLRVAEAQIARLERENNNFLEQFQTWASNARMSGISYETLNRPLDPIDRSRSSESPKKPKIPKRLEVVFKPTTERWKT